LLENINFILVKYLSSNRESSREHSTNHSVIT